MKQIEKMNAARNKAWPCVICKNKSTQLIYKRADYALARYGFKTEKEITQDIEYPLEIFYCSECNYAWNEKYSKKLLSYKSNKIIEAAPHSKTYQQFQKKMAENISNNLFDGRINIALEIGAGTGNFIKHINATRKIAFEPSEEAKQIPLDIEVINDYFNPTEVVNNADIIILRQVLEHIPEPVNFLREIISNVESKKNFYLYIEVPNSRKTFQNGRFQDFYFEHYSYFTSKTIAKISSILGTELETISNEMDGEILAVMLRVNNNLPNIEENIRSQERKIHQLIFETHRDKKKLPGAHLEMVLLY